MGQHARIGLLLGATLCLLAVMVDWIVDELRGREVEHPAVVSAAPRA
jgi:hypothetical protein